MENFAFIGGVVRPSLLKPLISEERDEMSDNTLNTTD